jgi:hypothetical protein
MVEFELEMKKKGMLNYIKPLWLLIKEDFRWEKMETKLIKSFE